MVTHVREPYAPNIGGSVDRPSEMLVWQPDGPELLEGLFHLEGGLNWTVRTEDGAVWLLEAEAARQLESLGPDEGQLFRWRSSGSSPVTR